MRHRAPRQFTNLWHRLPRSTARLVGQAARLRPGSALIALVVVLGAGAAAYAALTSVTGGGSSSGQAESSAPSTSRGDESQNVSRDRERSSLTDELPGPDDPTPSASTSAPSTPAAERPAARRVTASTAPEDGAPPNTRLSAVFPAGNAATFSVSADEPASFTCSLDGAAYTPCDSQTHYSDLTPGWHTFAVRATDTAGNVDPSPAETRWHARDGRSANQ